MGLACHAKSGTIKAEINEFKSRKTAEIATIFKCLFFEKSTKYVN